MYCQRPVAVLYITYAGVYRRDVKVGEFFHVAAIRYSVRTCTSVSIFSIITPKYEKGNETRTLVQREGKIHAVIVFYNAQLNVTRRRRNCN